VTEQSPLWDEDIDTALGAVVMAAGGARVVASEWFPAEDPTTKARYINNCLNPDRNEKFSSREFLWLLRKGRELDCHAIMYFICDDAGYEKTQPINPEDEKERLQRELNQKLDDVRLMLNKLGKVS